MNTLFKLIQSVIGTAFMLFIMLLPYIMLGIYIAYPPVNNWVFYTGISIIVLLIIILKPITLIIKTTRQTNQKFQ